METEMMTSSKVKAGERRMGKVTLNAENHNTPGYSALEVELPARESFRSCELSVFLPSPTLFLRFQKSARPRQSFAPTDLDFRIASLQRFSN